MVMDFRHLIILLFAMTFVHGATCPDGWVKYMDSACFKVNVEKEYSWKAYNNCKALGGKLATVHSQSENDFLNGVLSYLRVDNVWLGMNDMKTSGVYKWEDEEITFNNFADEKVNNDGVNHTAVDCVEMRSDLYFKWNKQYCFYKNAYLCRMNPSLE